MSALLARLVAWWQGATSPLVEAALHYTGLDGYLQATYDAIMEDLFALGVSLVLGLVLALTVIYGFVPALRLIWRVIAALLRWVGRLLYSLTWYVILVLLVGLLTARLLPAVTEHAHVLQEARVPEFAYRVGTAFVRQSRHDIGRLLDRVEQLPAVVVRELDPPPPGPPNGIYAEEVPYQPRRRHPSVAGEIEIEEN